MKGIIPAVAVSILSILLLCGNLRADNSQYGIMRPDHDTLRRWISEYEKAEKAPIDEKIKSRLSMLEAADVTTSMSLLSYIPYLGSQRNQGSCGNCWVWAGTGLMEVAHSVQNGVSDRLSIQYLNSCKTDEFACNGGSLSGFANWYDNQERAIPWSNSNASYADGNGPASSNTACASIAASPNYPLEDITPQTVATTGTVTQEQAIANIKNVLNQNKAVWFAFWLANGTDWDAFNNFWSNSAESVLWNPDSYCGHTWDNDSGGGHAVIIVGYNEDDPDPEKHYWTVLNSWGVNTGRPQGTFRMKMKMNYGCMLHETGYSDFYNNQFQSIGINYVNPCNPPASISVPAESTGTFTVSWGASSTPGVTYVLEESDSSAFTGTTVAYTGAALSATITKTMDGAFYYRVRATKSGYGASVYAASATGCVVDFPAAVTINSSDVPKALPDRSTVVSTLTAPPDSCPVVSDVNVILNITHTWISDLSITLAHNTTGRTVQLFNMGCIDSGYANMTAIFDDEAPAAVQCPPNGTYKPYALLSTFDGINASGAWTLTISDNAGGDSGTLNSWGIAFVCGGSSQLSVAVSGDGSVNSAPSGIACTTGNAGICFNQFNFGSPVNLTASGVNGPTFLSHFGSWGGDYDSASSNTSSVTMDGNKNITATFVTNQPVQIPGGSQYASLQAAYDAQGANAVTIWSQAVELLNPNFLLDKGKTVTLKGGYDSSYGSNGGVTMMKGALTVGTGSLTVERLSIK